MSLFSGENPQLGSSATVDGLKIQNVAHLDVVLTSTSANANVFIAPTAYKITAVREVHGVVGGSGATVNLEVIPSGTANGSGVAVLPTALSLVTTVNVPHTAVLPTNGDLLIIPAGSRLGTVVAGTLTGLGDALLQISLTRL